MKIKRQIVLVLLIVSIVPLVITNSYIMLAEKESHVSDIVSRLESIASIQKARIEAVYDQNIETVRIVSGRTQLRVGIAKYANSSNKEENNKIKPILADAIGSVSGIKNIYIFNFSGDLISQGDDDYKIDTEVLNKSYKLGKHDRQAKVFFREDNGVVNGAFSGPLMMDGRNIGVVVLVMSVSNMLLVTEEYAGLGETGETILAMATVNGDALFVNPTRFNQNPAFKFIVPKDNVNNPIIGALQGEVKAYENYIDYRGAEVIAVTRFVPKVNFGLVVKIDKSEAYSEFYHQLIYLGFMFIAIFFTVIIISVKLANRIMSPIDELTQLAKDISDGDLSVVAAESKVSEVGLLGASFNLMTKSLKKNKSDLTENIKALKSNSDRFDRWMHSSFIGVYQSKTNGDIVDANDAFLSLIGCSRSELEGGGINWLNITPREYLLLDEAAMNDADAKGCWAAYEKELLHKDGRRIPILIGGAFFDDDNSEYIAFVVDLTERIQSEARWQIALDGGEIGVWDMDLIAGKVFYSNTWKDIVGLSGVNIDSDWRDMIHPDDKAQCLNLLRNHMDGDLSIYSCEHRIKHGSGGYKWVLSKGKVIERLSNNLPSRVIGTTEDIEKRKTTEQALSNHMDLDRMISEVSSILIRLNLDDLNDGMNEVAKKIARYLNADILSIFTYHDDQVHLIESYSWRKEGAYLPRTPKSGFSMEEDFPWLSQLLKSGTALFNLTDIGEFPIDAGYEKKHIERYGFKSFILIPLMAANKPVGFIRCASKSEKIWNEVSVSFLLILTDSIAHLLERDKINDELYRVQKMEAVGQLTGGIAHDFNNILGVIIGNLDLLKRQFVDDKPATKRLSSALKASKRAAKLTKDLLAFSRKKVTEKVTVDINDSLKDMEQLFVHTLAHQVDVVFDFGHDLWLAEIDPGDFQDACINLLINARDAMPKGGEIIFVTENIIVNEHFSNEHIGLSEGEYILLSVIDSGTGMPPAVLQHIFDPFYSTKLQGEGTGLGLSMVFGFVKRSGGYLDVKSIVGVGSEFQLYFPRTIEQHAHVDINHDDTVVFPLASETILIVDDEEDLLELASEYLNSQGYKVLTANRGAQALDILADNSDVSLLLSDIMMPGGINGYQLAERACEVIPNIKVLLTSGYAEQKNFTDSQDRFNDNLLSKPYNQNELLLRVSSMLRNVSLDVTPVLEP